MPLKKRKSSETGTENLKDETERKRRRNPVRKSKTRQAKSDADICDRPQATKKLSPAIKTAVSKDTIAGNDISSEDGSSDDWEEVEEGVIGNDESSSDHEPVIPKEGVEVTLEAPADAKCGRRQKKRFDLNEYFRKQLSKFKRELQESMHKVHLLCMIARGLHVNAVINEDIVRAVALSQVPAELLMSTSRKKMRIPKDAKEMQSWYRRLGITASLQDGDVDGDHQPFSVESILQDIKDKTPKTPFRSVVIMAVFLRIIGLDVRIVFSFRPVPLKPPSASASTSTTKPCSKKEIKGGGDDGGPEKVESNKPAKAASVKRKRKIAESSKIAAPKLLKEKSLSPTRRSGRLHKRHLSVSLKAKERSSSSSSSNSSSSSVIADNDDAQDEDFKVEVIKLNNPGPLRGVKKNRKALSSDSDCDADDVRKSRASHSKDCWLEVYLDELRQWTCVHPLDENLDEPHKIEKWITQPIKYVVAFDGAGHVKDVTKRYASGWLCHTRKLRVDADWWNETLEPFRGPLSRRERDEDSLLDQNLKDRPLPTTISEYKNHPLYALKRHLLKFEGIYPSDAVPVGFVRGEPVYPRHCIRDLHSRETWLKEARLVRIGETPYKVVKARPKWNKAIGEMQSDLPLEVFGEWQTEEYIPPPAKDGKVPRNDYGNVELFKPCMLPPGTVHLQIPGLNRVARKLDIDCAAAMTGWDFHGVGSHPIFDGWIVCEEFKDVLLDAWREEQAIIDAKEQEKREKRIYGNWRRVIRGLLIRERLQLKYGSPATAADSFEDASADTKKPPSKVKTKKR